MATFDINLRDNGSGTFDIALVDPAAPNFLPLMGASPNIFIYL